MAKGIAAVTAFFAVVATCALLLGAAFEGDRAFIASSPRRRVLWWDACRNRAMATMLFPNPMASMK